MRRVILCDLNYTLAANSHARKDEEYRTFRDFIRRGEEYRAWLVTQLQDAQHDGWKVALITYRLAVYQDDTLQRIAEMTGHWTPDEAYFRRPGVQGDPARVKRLMLERAIYGRHGKPGEATYLALESNKATRAMYQAQSIRAVDVRALRGDSIFVGLQEGLL